MQLQRIAALLVVFATVAFAQKPLQLAVGTQKSLTLQGIQRVALGDPAIADIKTIGQSELLVIGLSAGHTTLLVWKRGVQAPEKFDISVTGPGHLAPPAPVLAEDTTPPPSYSPVLKVGEKATRPTPKLARVAVGDPDVADISTGDSTLTLTGGKPGQTTVLLWFEDGHRESWAISVVK
jgi:Flp pilus assembly secretin CpaC